MREKIVSATLKIRGWCRTRFIRKESRERCIDPMGEIGNFGSEPRPNIVCIAYDARGNGGGGTSPTITGDHQNRITDYTAIVLEIINDADIQKAEKSNVKR